MTKDRKLTFKKHMTRKKLICFYTHFFKWFRLVRNQIYYLVDNCNCQDRIILWKKYFIVQVVCSISILWRYKLRGLHQWNLNIGMSGLFSWKLITRGSDFSNRLIKSSLLSIFASHLGNIFGSYWGRSFSYNTQKRRLSPQWESKLQPHLNYHE